MHRDKTTKWQSGYFLINTWGVELEWTDFFYVSILCSGSVREVQLKILQGHSTNVDGDASNL